MDTKRFLILASFLASIGCNSQTPKLVPLQPETPAQKPQKVEVEPIVQVVNPEVDILFVIDNSGSMIYFQQQLSNNIDGFIKALTSNIDLDWHIAATTSNTEKMWPGSHGKFLGSPNVVTKNTPNYLKVLKENLVPGANQDLGLEKFFDPIRMALEPSILSGYNKNFFRDNAKLVIILITDSDDQSGGTVQEPIDFLTKLKKQRPEKLATYAALASLAKGCEPSGEPYPKRILEFLTKTNGGYFSICDLGLGKVKELADDISKNFQVTIPLQRRPQLSTIEVHYGSVLVPSDPQIGWLYNLNNNTIQIGPKFNFNSQPSGTKFRVNYTSAD